MGLHNNLVSTISQGFYIKLEYNEGRKMWESYVINCSSDNITGEGRRAYEALKDLTDSFIEFEMENQ